MYGRSHLTQKEMFSLLFILLSLLPRQTLQVCLPQYDYMVSFYNVFFHVPVTIL